MSKIRITDNEKIKAIESYIQGEMINFFNAQRKVMILIHL